MSGVAKYRKKPVEIDAIQWDGEAETATIIINWILHNGGTARYHEKIITTNFETGEEEVEPACMYIHTLEGAMRADKDDWIIKGVVNEFYPCKDNVFQATYEVVDG